MHLMLLVFATLAISPAMAATQQQSFSVTGSNGECGIGQFSYDDQVLSNEPLFGDGVRYNPSLSDNTMTTFSLTLRRGNVIDGETVFEKEDCSIASAFPYPDFEGDISFTCDNGVNKTAGEYYNSVMLNESSSASSRLTVSPGVSVSCPPFAKPVPAMPFYALLLLGGLLGLFGLRRLRR